MSTIETARLTLRAWREDDAAALFRWASDPEVGPRAGWPAHGSEAESLEIIRTVLSVPETYALVVRGRAPADEPIGSVGIKIGQASELARGGREGELGCWVAREFWGRGYVPEALRELMRHAFRDLRLEALWYGFYDSNDQSRRVAEKLGFRPDHVIEQEPRPLLGDTARTHAWLLERERWERGGGRASGPGRAADPANETSL